MFTPEEKQIIDHAAAIFLDKIKSGDAFTSPEITKRYCQSRLATNEREVFLLLILDNQHRLIEGVELFHGTIDAASVYPREVAKSVLENNGAAAIFAHNHPSGSVEPSASDRRITVRLKEALELFDVRTLDHIVVGAEGTFSFAEHGFI